MRLALSLPVLALCLVACASDPAITILGDGHYRVQCRERLLECLEPAAKACAAHGYDVVSAEERREVAGPGPYQTEVLKSVAEVRCRRPTSLFGGGCVPGTSQACTAKTGCAGAQLCAADGGSFGACECAPPPAPVIAPDAGAEAR